MVPGPNERSASAVFPPVTGGIVRLVEALTCRPRSAPTRWRRATAEILSLGGAALLAGSAVIHVHLWSGTYGHIPTVGTLFLFQGVVGLVSAALLAVFRRVWTMALAAALLLATAGGLLLSHWAGLFGYAENLAVPYAGMSLVLEFGGAAVLVTAAFLTVAGRAARRSTWDRAGPSARSPSTVTEPPAVRIRRSS